VIPTRFGARPAVECRPVICTLSVSPDEAVTAYSALPAREQLRVLAEYSHDLTVIARGTGHLRHLISGNMKRYPDDVIVRTIIAEDDAELLSAFEAAIRRFR